MKRVAIIGSPGAGKSTFARELANKTGLPLIHLDFYYHETGKNYYSDKNAWIQRVKELIDKDSWIMDGNYSSTIPERLARADTIIYFDVSRIKALRGVIKRRVTHRNKKRPDMPDDWVEKVNWEFLRYVWNYKKLSKTKQKIEEIIEAGDKRVIVLMNRKQSQEYLDKLR